MTDRSLLCCFPSEIAVRIIGTVSLIVYAFVFTLLCSNAEDDFKNGKIRVVLGLDARFFRQPENERMDWFAVFCLVSTAISIVSSALLVCSSITKQRILTFPWIFSSSANFLTHIGSFILLGLSNLYSREKWMSMLAVLYTVAIAYFLVTVLAAQFSWRFKQRRRYSQEQCLQIWEDMFQPREPPQKSSI